MNMEKKSSSSSNNSSSGSGSFHMRSPNSSNTNSSTNTTFHNEYTNIPRRRKPLMYLQQTKSLFSLLLRLLSPTTLSLSLSLSLSVSLYECTYICICTVKQCEYTSRKLGLLLLPKNFSFPQHDHLGIRNAFSKWCSGATAL